MEEVQSKIFEVAELSNSITDMSKSINNYQNMLEEKVKERTEELNQKKYCVGKALNN